MKKERREGSESHRDQDETTKIREAYRSTRTQRNKDRKGEGGVETEMERGRD